MDNSAELVAVLDRIANVKVLVIGDVMLDRYWLGASSRISPEAPVPVVCLNQSRDIPGGAANVASNLYGLRAEAYLAGVIGDDETGRLLCCELKRSRISPEFLLRCTQRPTTSKTRVMVDKHQVVRIDSEVSYPISKEEGKRLFEKVLGTIPELDVVVLSDYAKGCLTEDLIADVIGEARRHAKPIVVDPKTRDFSKYGKATVVTPNLSEAMLAANLEYRNGESIDDAGKKILGTFEIESLLITLGENGMKLFRRDSEPIHFHSVARRVFDVTGAGDTVIASIAASLGANASLEQAMHIANVAAGIVVEKVGTSLVSATEIKAALRAEERF